MTSTTPRSGAPLLAAAQAQKHVTHNEALYQFDAFLCVNFLSRVLTAPPVTLADGETWLVAAAATGDWAGHDGAIAYRADGAWRFYAPFAGLVAYVADETKLIVYDGAAWVDYASVLALQNVPLLGVNTAADATNKFAAKSSAVLFDNVGAGVQFKVNKYAVADTVSLLYQTGYSGRAEIGLTGDDDFHIKVSSDGAIWTEALVIAGSGNVGIGTASPAFTLEIASAGSPLGVRSSAASGGNVMIACTNASTPVTGYVGPNAFVDNVFSFGTSAAGPAPVAIFTASAQRMHIDTSGNVLIGGGASPTAKLDIDSDHVRLRTAKTPASALDTGNAGDICWDANYIYVCVATNTWKRAALASW